MLFIIRAIHLLYLKSFVKEKYLRKKIMVSVSSISSALGIGQKWSQASAYQKQLTIASGGLFLAKPLLGGGEEGKSDGFFGSIFKMTDNIALVTGIAAFACPHVALPIAIYSAVRGITKLVGLTNEGTMAGILDLVCAIPFFGLFGRLNSLRATSSITTKMSEKAITACNIGIKDAAEIMGNPKGALGIMNKNILRVEEALTAERKVVEKATQGVKTAEEELAKEFAKHPSISDPKIIKCPKTTLVQKAEHISGNISTKLKEAETKLAEVEEKVKQAGQNVSKTLKDGLKDAQKQLADLKTHQKALTKKLEAYKSAITEKEAAEKIVTHWEEIYSDAKSAANQLDTAINNGIVSQEADSIFNFYDKSSKALHTVSINPKTFTQTLLEQTYGSVSRKQFDGVSNAVKRPKLFAEKAKGKVQSFLKWCKTPAVDEAETITKLLATAA